MTPHEILDSCSDEMCGMRDSGIVHSLGVARMCYALARVVLGADRDVARQMFAMGLLHDMGYEFAPEGMDHAGVAADILEGMSFPPECVEAIRLHEQPDDAESEVLDILLCADMLVDGSGRVVDTFAERLADIAARHSGDGAYREGVRIARLLREHGFDF